MKKDDLVYIQDIQKAIKKVDRYLKNIVFEQFKQEEMRQDAIIRQLEIIGEAANKLSPEFCQTNKDFPIKEAVSLRNFLIHDYDDIDLDVIWKTVQEDIPLLKEKIKLLNQ